MYVYSEVPSWKWLESMFSVRGWYVLLTHLSESDKLSAEDVDLAHPTLRCVGCKNHSIKHQLLTSY